MVNWLMSLSDLREVKSRWYAMRLGNDDATIQVSAARALGEMGPKAKGAVPALIAALDSSRSEVRDAAAWALGEIGSDAEAAIESLIRLATEGNSGFLEAHAASLGFVTQWQIVNSAIEIEKPPRVVLGAVLLLPTGAYFDHKADRVKLNASEALGKIGEPGVKPFITALQDKNPSVREHAAESLGRILLAVPDPKLAQKAMQPLINALHDDLPYDQFVQIQLTGLRSNERTQMSATGYRSRKEPRPGDLFALGFLARGTGEDPQDLAIAAVDT